ncbi:hypothetical protein AB0G71_14385 [Streptomyces sp. NPDC020403]
MTADPAPEALTTNAGPSAVVGATDRDEVFQELAAGLWSAARFLG